ncbi:rhomboid family intramembrane serine protease [Arenimonas fontis]|nr:rhomboid family intramembrane serine protease [Arenimonas fontis]
MDPEQRQYAEAVRQRLRRGLLATMAFVAALGAIHFSGPWPGALVPQSPAGLIGVLTAPLLHGSPGHWLGNGVALLLLAPLVHTVYPRATLRALPLIWLGSGLGTWFIAAGDAPHIGASGLTHGLGFLLFALGLLRRDRTAIAAGLIAFFFYGGMLLTVLPREPGVSWEYHLCGAAMGVLAALRWRRLDPPPPRQRYSWESEDPEGDAGRAKIEDPLEPPPPREVPVLWQRPEEPRGQVLPFRPRRRETDDGDV